MRKITITFIIIAAFLFVGIFNNTKVIAASVIASVSDEDIFGEQISSVRVFNNGKVELQYKYGLKKVDMYYCVKGESCDQGVYNRQSIMEATLDEPYKNTESGMAKYTFAIDLDKKVEYRVRIEAYFGTSNAYSGGESVTGAFTVGAVQIADTNDNYINGNAAKDNVSDSRLSDLLEKIRKIVNNIILPIIYTVTSVFLVIKGAILGFQIVKSADQPDVRREKIGALKWLFIGVAIAYAATTAVGFVSGFFEDVFEL